VEAHYKFISGLA